LQNTKLNKKTKLNKPDKRAPTKATDYLDVPVSSLTNQTWRLRMARSVDTAAATASVVAMNNSGTGSQRPLSRQNTLRVALRATLAVIIVAFSVIASDTALAAKKAFPNGGRRSSENTATTSVSRQPSATKLAPGKPAVQPPSNRADPRLRRIGFRTQRKFDQHFQKHDRSVLSKQSKKTEPSRGSIDKPADSLPSTAT
jgi:hypothetical protein